MDRTTSTTVQAQAVHVGMEPALKGIRVLVVEDEADVRRLMVAVLGVYGATVETAANVDEGLAQFHRQRPDVLLSDIGMPGQDGYALIRSIRQHERDNPGQARTPAAAITAFAHASDRTRALEAGFDLHVAKPLKAPQLVDVISGLAVKRAG